MSEVKRYAFFAYIDEGDNAEFDYHIEPDGSWVKASDYDQLKAENERLNTRLVNQGGWLTKLRDTESERDTLRTQLAEARELFEYIKSDCTLSMLHRIDVWLEANP